MKLAHLVNPVSVGPESDLFVAQPITFETMRRARAYAAGEVEVEFFSAQFPEDHRVVPAEFTRTPDLNRSMLDFGEFPNGRKLPLLRDLLERLQAASEADYFIYTNVDIALMPTFYVTVAALLKQGFDSLIINRRTISTEYTRIEDLPLMYAQVGQIHPGRDCFVWRRAVQDRFRMENVCIGSGGVGKVMLVNQVATATRFREIPDFHLTFHLGDDRKWRGAGQDPYLAFNQGELRRVVESYRRDNLLPDHPLIRRFVARKGI